MSKKQLTSLRRGGVDGLSGCRVGMELRQRLHVIISARDLPSFLDGSGCWLALHPSRTHLHVTHPRREEGVSAPFAGDGVGRDGGEGVEGDVGGWHHVADI